MKILFVLIALFAASSVDASQCDDKFPNGKEVKVPNTVVLCNTFYVTVFDEAHNTAIFSSEVYQTKAGTVTRTNDFRKDARLKNGPTPDDYTNSGFDRGHLAAAADAINAQQMSDTFLMTNMTPQEPTVNRTPWRLLEAKVRELPYTYVVTGATYDYPAKVVGTHKVPVPTSYYKIVYLKDGSVQVFEAENKPKSPVVDSTLDAIEKKTGLVFH